MDKELFHFGVKGMKWGVRKDRNKKSGYSEDYNQTVDLRKRDPKTLSNKELQALNTRLQLERTNNQLRRNGQYYADKMIEKLGESVMQNIANSSVNAGKNYITKLVKNKIKR